MTLCGLSTCVYNADYFIPTCAGFFECAVVQFQVASLLRNLNFQEILWNRIGYFQLKGTCNDHLIQLADRFRADQKLKQIIKNIVQMPLKY